MTNSMKIPSAPVKLIQALASLHAMHEERPMKEMVANQAGMPAKNSTMRNACVYLKKHGLAETLDSKFLQLTRKGHDIARTLGEVQRPTSNKQFHDKYKAAMLKMNGGSKAIQIFDLLVDSPPMTKKEIAAAINSDVSKSTFRNGMAPLNKLGLIENCGNDKYQLTDKCFPVVPRRVA